MPRPSSITQLPEAIKEKIDALIRDGRHTLDAILAKLDELDADVGISRSALGRYKKSVETQVKEMQQARQMADVWVDKLGHEPEGKMGRLMIELIRTLAFKVTVKHSEGDAAGVKAGDVFFLSKAIKELESAYKISADREMKIREHERAEAAKAVAQEGKAAGLSDDTIATIKQRILGARQ